MPPYRIDWLDEARTDVRALDRPAAMRIFDAVLHFAQTGAGDVTPLHGDILPAHSASALVVAAFCSRWSRIRCEFSVCGTAPKRIANG